MSTIHDVAHASGVSIQTVSNVLHGKDFVRPEIQARVREAVAQLHYLPNRAAQRMRGQKSHTLGFVLSDPNPRGLADPFYGEVLSGIAEVARARNHDVLIEWLPSDQPIQPAQLLAPFKAQRIDAAVIFLHGVNACNTALLNALAEAQLPIAILECDVMGDRAFSVLSANRDGAYAATEHVIKAGHKRVAFVHSTQRWPSVDERWCGYEAAMTAHGLDKHIASFISPDWTAEGGAAAVQPLLSMGVRKRPTALVAASDLLAVGALRAMKAAGLRVPDDIAITGFDDFDFAQYVEPALTTVRLPVHEMGQQAATVLLDCLQGKATSTSKRVVLPTQLIVRQSA